MVDVAGKLAVGLAVSTFECEEDVARLPVPMKIVEARVERMLGGVKIRVAMVNCFAQSYTKAYRLKISFWD